MKSIIRVLIGSTLLSLMMSMLSETVFAACNATINGRPMSPQECAVNTQIYGRVIPGNYLVDYNGNWVNVNNPRHRGNVYMDAQRARNGGSWGGGSGGSWGGGSVFSPKGIYDPSGGCEGGSCVNIID